MIKKRLRLQMLILILFSSVLLIIPNTVSIAHAKTSYTTYYKLKKDGQTLKLICDIEVKAYFDEKADMYKAKYKIKKAGSSKYVKLSNKKFKKLEKKYKIIKAI